MLDNDPLWKLRHALVGLGVALLISVLMAAWAGAVVGGLLGGGYNHRVAAYAALLVYVVVGAAVLFAKVLRHETRPLSAGRALLWVASLWTWPLLLAASKKKLEGGER